MIEYQEQWGMYNILIQMIKFSESSVAMNNIGFEIQSFIYLTKSEAGPSIYVL